MTYDFRKELLLRVLLAFPLLGQILDPQQYPLVACLCLKMYSWLLRHCGV